MDLINGLLDKKVDTHIQRTVVNGLESYRHQSQVSLRSPHWYCYLVLFTVFINNTDEGIECILSKFEDDTKLRDAVDSLERWNDIQTYLDKLKKWANGNLRRFNRIRYKVVHLHQGNPQYQYKLCDGQIKSNLA